MDYSHFAILLLLLSLALLVAEVFIPSGGVISVVMLICLVGSVFCAFRAWWHSSPTIWWSYITGVALLLPGVLIAAFTIFPRTSYGRRVLLDAPSPEEIAPYAREQAELHQLIGKRGKAVTPHGPAGIVTVEGRRHHSETRGMMLGSGEEIEVVAVKGNRLVVRPADVILSPAELLEPPPVAVTPPALEAPAGSLDIPFDPFLDDSRRV